MSTIKNGGGEILSVFFDVLRVAKHFAVAVDVNTFSSCCADQPSNPWVYSQ